MTELDHDTIFFSEMHAIGILTFRLILISYSQTAVYITNLSAHDELH